MTPLILSDAVEAVAIFDLFPYFSQTGPEARLVIAEEFMRLANLDIEKIVDRVCSERGTARDAILNPPRAPKKPAPGEFYSADEQIALMEYRASRDAREELADIFGRVGFSLADLRRYIYISDAYAAENYRQRLPHEPKERLKVFVPWFVRAYPAGFPGLGPLEIEWGGQWCKTDGSSESRVTGIEGHTLEDHEAGNISPMLPAAPEPLRIEAPAEKIAPADARDIAEKFSILKRRLIAGAEE